MKSKYRSSVSDENSVSKVQRAVGIKYTRDFKDSVWKTLNEF